MKKQANIKGGGNLDYHIFTPTLIIVCLFSIFVILNRDLAMNIMNKAFEFLTYKLGFMYMMLIVISVGICIYLIFGPLANKRIGNEEPEFSTFSWVGMVFSSCSSAALLIWATFESYYYITSPPFGIAANSAEAIEMSQPFVMFHWGIVPYSLMTALGAVFAYYIFIQKRDVARPSIACVSLLGEKNVNGGWGKVIDILFLVSLVAGMGTTLGLATPLISDLLQKMFGIQRTMTSDIIILIAWTIMISITVYQGLKKGIKVLSDIRVYILIAILTLVLILGPTSLIINNFIDSIGIMFQNTFRMIFHTDPVRNTGFPQTWTIFYYAWYVTLAIQYGIYLARISRGRTIREFTIGTLFGGGIANWIVIAILGNTSIEVMLKDMSHIQQVYEMSGMTGAVVEIWSNLPLGSVLLVGFLILAFVSTGTFINSCVYTIAMTCSSHLKGDEEPSKILRIIWAVVLGVFAVAILYMGSLSIIQTSSIVGAFPMVFVIIMIFISFFKATKNGWEYTEDQEDTKIAENE